MAVAGGGCASNGLSAADSIGWYPQTTKNRKVSIEDVIHHTVDIHKFRNKDDKKPGEKEAMEDASIKNMRPSSPRSLMACLRLGIDPEEVVYRCAASRPSPLPVVLRTFAPSPREILPTTKAV
jgi:hypothetical protein